MKYFSFKSKKNKFYQKILTIYLLVTVFYYPSFAQKNQIPFDHLTVESGLSQSRIFSIAQDSMGFMWFGTKDGLNRYDSHQFEVFRNNANDSTTLSSSQNINALLTCTSSSSLGQVLNKTK